MPWDGSTTLIQGVVVSNGKYRSYMGALQDHRLLYLAFPLQQ